MIMKLIHIIVSLALFALAIGCFYWGCEDTNPFGCFGFVGAIYFAMLGGQLLHLTWIDK